MYCNVITHCCFATVSAAVHCIMANKSKALKSIYEHLNFFIDLVCGVVANATSNATSKNYFMNNAYTFTFIFLEITPNPLIG